MKWLLLSLLSLLLSPLAAKNWGADKVVKIWDNSSAPHSNGFTGQMYDLRENRPTNITEAKLFIFEPEEKTSSQAVVICPGGGYNVLSMDEEGSMMAEWFNEQGVTAAVLQYRTPNGVCEVPLEDVERALEIMRSKAAQLGIDPEQVGVYGASAGGHLAASASTLLDKQKRPNFTVLFYPVITSKEGISHKGSFNKLLGEDRTEEESMRFSLDEHVDGATPPAIIFLCDDDRVVPARNSTLYYNALKAHGIPAALHIYPVGGHGWGNSSRPTFQREWQRDLSGWLKLLNSDKILN